MVNLDTGHRNRGFQVEQIATFPGRLRGPGRRARKWSFLRRELDLLLPGKGAVKVVCPDRKEAKLAIAAARYWARKNKPGRSKIITGSEPADNGQYHLYIALETVEEG